MAALLLVTGPLPHLVPLAAAAPPAVAHPPILIVDDADLAAQAAAEGWSGNGTPAAPYVIPPYRIVPAGGWAVDVRGTRAHIVVNALVVTGTAFDDKGVRLWDAQNVTIDGATLRALDHALLADEGSAFVLVKGGTVRESIFGVRIQGNAHDIDVNGTFFERNAQAVRLDWAANVTVANATFLFGTNAHVAKGAARDFFVLDSVVDRTRRPFIADPGAARGVYRNLTVMDPITGFQLSGTSDMHVEACTVTDGESGIRFLDSVRAVATGNVLRHHRYGVHVEGSPDALVSSNTLRQDDQGVFVLDSPRVRVTGNDGRNNNQSVTLSASVDARIDNNTFAANGDGVRILLGSHRFLARENTFIENGAGFYAFASDDGSVVNNTFDGKTGQGIRLDTLRRTTVMDNEIVNGLGYGIQLRKAHDGILRHNTLVGNAIGLHMDSATGNLVFDNRFVNDVDAEVIASPGNAWNVAPSPGPNIIGGPLLGGNSWNAYTGFDLDGDGHGDIPHGPVAYGTLPEPNPVTNLVADTLPYGPYDKRPLMTGTLAV